jgi:hypothetical protein
MIIGNGDIASVLIDREDLLFFASGVSNSREKNPSEFEREMKLLFKQDHKMHIVYFSSLAIFYSDTNYTRHKKNMETLIKGLFHRHTIVRLGNISWGTNPNTLINYINNCRKNGKSFEVQDTYRYVVDKEEFLHWMNMIPEWNCEMNITGKWMKVEDIVKVYCKG